MYSLISTNQVLVKAANKHIMENHTITKYNEVNIFILMEDLLELLQQKKMQQNKIYSKENVKVYVFVGINMKRKETGYTRHKSNLELISSNEGVKPGGEGEMNLRFFFYTVS